MPFGTIAGRSENITLLYHAWPPIVPIPISTKRSELRAILLSSPFPLQFISRFHLPLFSRAQVFLALFSLFLSLVFLCLRFLILFTFFFSVLSSRSSFPIRHLHTRCTFHPTRFSNYHSLPGTCAFLTLHHSLAPLRLSLCDYERSYPLSVPETSLL